MFDTRDRWLERQLAQSRAWRSEVEGRMNAAATSRSTHAAAKALAPEPDSLALFAKGQELYALLSCVHVDAGPFRAAKRMTDLASQALGCRAPDVQWFDRRRGMGWRNAGGREVGTVAGPLDSNAFYLPSRPNSIYVKATATAREAAAWVAHETKHYHQHQVLGTVPPRGDPRRDELERDANAFAEHMLNQFDTDGD